MIDFIVVGVAKGGTTALYYYLNQHPDVFIPEIKECRFFSNVRSELINPFSGGLYNVRMVKNWEDYKKLFKGREKFLKGEVSPDYFFYYKESIKNIIKYVGKNVKIIIILRNPVERAISNYFHLLREKDVNREVDLKSYIEFERDFDNDDRVWYFFKILKSSVYSIGLENYLSNFRYVKIIIFEEFIKNPELHMKKIFEFLGLTIVKLKKPVFTNKSGVPKSRFLEEFLSNYRIKNFAKKYLSYLFGYERLKNIKLKLLDKNTYKPEVEKEFVREKLYLEMEKTMKILSLNKSIWI